MITVNFEEGKALYLQLYDYIKEDIIHNRMAKDTNCLLYTSDAADDLLTV